MTQKKIFIYGKHAVKEALLHAPQVLRKIFLSSQMDDKELRQLIQRSGIPIEKLDLAKVHSMVEHNAPHQGVVAFVALGELVTPAEKFFDTFAPTKDTLLVFLSEIQDPHNVGAIIRSAAAFGASAVLLPTYKQSPITGAVIKASAGMAFQLPLVSVDNTQQTIAKFKKMGVRVYGLAANSGTQISDEPFAGPSILVLGNEATGVGPAARALCDRMLSIPIVPEAESLNVAASAAVALYAWSRAK